MKALEILETLRDEYIHGELTSDIEEAIKELEELQNRSCSSCRYFIELDNHPDKDGYCDNRNIGTYSLEDEDGIALDVNKNFCCNKWEGKNEK